MAALIQFPSHADWRWLKTGGFFLLASLVSLIFWGPLWALAFSILGMIFSFMGFLHSLRAGSGTPPLLLSIVLALFHALFIGIALVLYVLFVLPITEQSIPAFTSQVSDPSGRLSVRVPIGWQAQPVLTDPEPGMFLKPLESEKIQSIQEIKIQLKKTAVHNGKWAINQVMEPSIKSFTVKKFWFRIHHISVMGYKGPDTLCSVSVVALPPHLNFAQDLCKAVFKNVEVPVTIKQ